MRLKKHENSNTLTIQSHRIFSSIKNYCPKICLLCFDSFFSIKSNFFADDCFWDFSQCTHKSDLPCCQNRFDKCCLHIMPPPTPTPQDPPPTRPPTKKSTTMAPCQNRVRQHAGNLIGCVWQFNNCIEEKYKCRHSEDICYQRFDDCKMLVMGKIRDKYVLELLSWL